MKLIDQFRMQAFKKKDPYVQSTRQEIVKPTFNGKLCCISQNNYNEFLRCIAGETDFVNSFIQNLLKLVFHIPEDKRCLRMDECYLSFNVRIPLCYLPGKC